MAHIDNTKVYDKKVNFSCLLISLALLVLAIFGYSTTLAEFDIAGFGIKMLEDIELDMIPDMIEADIKVGKAVDFVKANAVVTDKAPEEAKAE